jgi:hypothetical protein
MLSLLFHSWERRLAAVSKDRVVRPFEWGLDWLPPTFDHHGDAPNVRVGAYVDSVLADPTGWFSGPPSDDFELGLAAADGSKALRFPSAVVTRHP